MAECNEDDMIVFVVGDEENSTDDQQSQVPCPNNIKIEPIHDSAENTSGNDLGRLPAQNQKFIKEEYVKEYLVERDVKAEVVEEMEDYDVEYLEDSSSEFGNKHEDNQDHEIKKTKRKLTVRKRTPNKNKEQNDKKFTQNKHETYDSFVKLQREMYPHLAEDDQALVEHLASIMRTIKPPPPPKGFCTEIKGPNTKYECTYCGTQSNSPAMARRHHQFSHGELYLTCYACGSKHKNTTNLYKHEKRCPAPDARLVLRARGCFLGRKGRGRPFITANKFVTDNTFSDRPRSSSRLYCTKCPESFVHRDNLEAHENLHEGLRPYRCHHCPMAYSSRPTLKRHIKQHGAYQFICDHCGQKFKLKTVLIQHLDTHLPFRRYGCTHCDRRFSQKPALRHHINTVHLDLPPAHGCPVCPKRYARLTLVREHMNRVHGLKMITRKMYFRTLPKMTDTEVKEVSKHFHKVSTEWQDVPMEPDYILPDKSEITKQRYIKVIKKNTKINIEPEPEEPEPVEEVDNLKEAEYLEDAEYLEEEEYLDEAEYLDETEYLEVKAESAEKTEPARETEHDNDFTTFSSKEKILNERKPKQKKRKKGAQPPIKIDEEIDDDLSYIEYKRQRKSVFSAASVSPALKEADEEMNKTVRNIKSELGKKVVNTRAEKKNPTKNFYELKREFMDQLKNEIDTPDDEENPENLVPGTEIPKDLVSWTKIPECNVAQKNATDEDTTNDDEWKVHKNASEKNKVIADFLDYMKSGVVPKRVPILRRGNLK